ncbi:hypothetical protein U1Q18_051942, partial [Sarracenia purpurea var. burkii]
MKKVSRPSWMTDKNTSMVEYCWPQVRVEDYVFVHTAVCGSEDTMRRLPGAGPESGWQTTLERVQVMHENKHSGVAQVLVWNRYDGFLHTSRHMLAVLP